MKKLILLSLLITACASNAPPASHMSWERLSVGKCYDVTVYMKPIASNQMTCPHSRHVAHEQSRDTNDDILAVSCVCR